jgi:UDP-GlcNAc:undecaprenyl-phosphate/decaprenyl-phosphate GlcNAc-1-phosphate transferase
MISVLELTLSVFSVAGLTTLILTPLARSAALRWNVLDMPSTPVKTHRVPTPYLGGAAIFSAVALTLLLSRFLTHFPTGTLRSLRALIIGGGFMMVVGLLDDLKKGGMDFRTKFFFQFLAAGLLLLFDIRIKFIQPVWLAQIFTLFWVVALTNAFNLIDIMDGLSSSQAFVACLGFLFIGLPGEEIYVNVAAAAVAGACLGFIPYNLSEKRKIFMGDAGSLFLGFSLATISLGTSYTKVTEFGLFAPFLLLGFPLYDTFFVSVLRLVKGRSPFLGSKDHLALKLRALGLSSHWVVLVMAVTSVLFSMIALAVTRAPFYVSFFLLAIMAVVGLYAIIRLHRVQVP